MADEMTVNKYHFVYVAEDKPQCDDMANSMAQDKLQHVDMLKDKPWCTNRDAIVEQENFNMLTWRSISIKVLTWQLT